MHKSSLEFHQHHEEDLTGGLTRIPKVELHLHLEGAMSLGSMWELMQKYGGDPSVPDPRAIAQRFQFPDLAHFIEVWIWNTGSYGSMRISPTSPNPSAKSLPDRISGMPKCFSLQRDS